MKSVISTSATLDPSPQTQQALRSRFYWTVACSFSVSLILIDMLYSRTSFIFGLGWSLEFVITVIRHLPDRNDLHKTTYSAFHHTAHNEHTAVTNLTEKDLLYRLFL